MGPVNHAEGTAWYLEATPAAVSKWLVRLRRAAAVIHGLVVVASIALPSGSFPLRATVIVVLTGYGSIATAVESVKLGAATYLTKPVDADQILAAFNVEAPQAAGSTPFAVPSLARVEWEHIQRVLADCGGNLSQAARALGIHRRSLQRKLSKDPVPESH